MKECSCCHLEFSQENFYRGSSACINCTKARSNARYRNKKEECRAAMDKWAAEHPDKIKETKKRWRDRNRETVVAYARYRRAVYPEAIAAANEKYRNANMEVYRAAQAKRRAAVLKATPKWADFEVINLYYEFAELLTEVTGVEYEVDHVVPLQGELVSGFHVGDNLRVITRNENRVKSNKFEEIENV